MEDIDGADLGHGGYAKSQKNRLEPLSGTSAGVFPS